MQKSGGFSIRVERPLHSKDELVMFLTEQKLTLGEFFPGLRSRPKYEAAPAPEHIPIKM